MDTGIVVTISGPSGCGKTTVTKKLLADCPEEWAEAVSVTTRPMRPGEVEGREYYFRTRTQFKLLAAKDAFIETVDYNGNLYGTLREELSRHTSAGRNTIIIAEPHGVHQIMERWVGPVYRIYLDPPSSEALRVWMLSRGDSPESVEARLAKDSGYFNSRDPLWNLVITSTTIDDMCGVIKRCTRERKTQLRNLSASDIVPRDPFHTSG